MLCPLEEEIMFENVLLKFKNHGDLIGILKEKYIDREQNYS